MVIITPNQFVSALQPLVEHKNNQCSTDIKHLNVTSFTRSNSNAGI